MSAGTSEIVKDKTPSIDFSAVASSATPITPATPSSQVKRGLTSPDFPLDPKKNKPCLSPMAHITEVVPMEGATGATGGSLPDSDGSQTKYSITLREADIAQISMALKESFRGDLHTEMATLVKSIVDGVLTGINNQMKTMETDITNLKKENSSLKAKVVKLELAAENAEQNSRRNCVRVSGVGENTTEDTDAIVLELACAVDAGVTLNEIDRSHRVGRPSAGKTRDIIVKFSTFRARQKLYTARTKLKTNGYAGVFINEDLTKHRSGLLFSARSLVKQRRLIGAWSSNGTILIKNNENDVERILKPEDLTTYVTAIPRPVDDGTTPPPLEESGSIA